MVLQSGFFQILVWPPWYTPALSLLFFNRFLSWSALALFSLCLAYFSSTVTVFYFAFTCTFKFRYIFPFIWIFLSSYSSIISLYASSTSYSLLLGKEFKLKKDFSLFASDVCNHYLAFDEKKCYYTFTRNLKITTFGSSWKEL